MKIKIRFTSPFSDAVGAKEMSIETASGTIRELVDELMEQYPGLKKMMQGENKEPTDYLSILVNDRPLSALDGMESRLQEGDDVLFLFPISGG